MNPMVLGSLISAGGSLLGGLFGGSKTESSRQAIMQHVRGVRDASNNWGFNPLTLLGITPSPATISANPWGAAISDAAMILGGDMKQRAIDAQQTALEQENQRLKKLAIEAQTRPQSSGVYAGRPDPSPIGAAVGADLREEESWRGAQRPPRNPLSPVSVYNPLINSWVDLNPLVAKRLDVKDGDALLASDVEDMFGDTGGEVINSPNVAQEVMGYGNTYGGMRGQKDTPTLQDPIDWVTGSGVHAGKPKKPKSRSRNPQGQR